MAEQQLLVRTPAPVPTESLFGYILRVSEANGYETPWHVLSHASMGQDEMFTPRLAVAKLATVVGLPQAELGAIEYVKTSSQGQTSLKLLDHDVGWSLSCGHIRLSKPAICPQCVASNGYIDAFWDLSVAVACPIHFCRAVDRCPKCEQPISWFRPGLLKCGCGADLLEHNSGGAETAVVELMGMLKAKVFGKTVLDQPNTSGFPAFAIESWSFGSFHRILNALGRYGHQSRSQSKCNDRDLIVENAAEVLTDWPNGYHRFLERLGGVYNPVRDDSIGLRKQFELFYVPMFKKSEEPETQFLRREFIRFGSTTWGTAKIDTRMLDEKVGDAKFLSKHAASLVSGVHPVTLRKWVEDGRLTATQFKTENKRQYFFDVNAVQSLILVSDKHVPKRNAASYLSLPPCVLESLELSGHFHVGGLGRLKRGFRQADLDSFLEKVNALAKSVEYVDVDIAEVESLKTVLKTKRYFSPTGRAELVRAFVDGKVRPLGRVGDSWTDVLISKADVDRYINPQDLRCVLLGLLAVDVAELLGCSPASINLLVDLRLLKAVKANGRVLIVRESVSKFSSRYVMLLAIARLHKTTVVALRRLCDRHRIPVRTLTNGESATYFIASKYHSELTLRFEQSQVSDVSNVEVQVSAFSKLQTYLEVISENGQNLPRRNGCPNIAQISIDCGVDRKTLSQHPLLGPTLQLFALEEESRLGLEIRDAVDLLQEYFESLSRDGLPLPTRRSGRPNVAAIARSVEISRDAIQGNQSAMSLIVAFQNAYPSPRNCPVAWLKRA